MHAALRQTVDQANDYMSLFFLWIFWISRYVFDACNQCVIFATAKCTNAYNSNSEKSLSSLLNCSIITTVFIWSCFAQPSLGSANRIAFSEYHKRSFNQTASAISKIRSSSYFQVIHFKSVYVQNKDA